MGPLVAELAAARQTNERQADTIGQLRADLATAQAENRALEARTAPQSVETAPRPPVPWGRASITVVMAVLAIIAVVVLLVRPW